MQSHDSWKTTEPFDPHAPEPFDKCPQCKEVTAEEILRHHGMCLDCSVEGRFREEPQGDDDVD